MASSLSGYFALVQGLEGGGERGASGRTGCGRGGYRGGMRS